MRTSVTARRRRDAVPMPLEQPSHYQAVVSRAPADETSSLDVTLVNGHGQENLLHTITSWPLTAALPNVGDECTVAFDDTMQPSITGWALPGWGHS